MKKLLQVGLNERVPVPPEKRFLITRPRDSLVVLALVALFFATNLPSITRYPCVWIDEVSYADPGISLATGHGWGSRCWYAQSFSEFWAGNVPVHPFLVACVTRAFGASIASVRILDYILVVMAIVLLWVGVERTNMVRSTRARALLFILVATGYSIVFSYRSARPDCITMLLAAGGLTAFSIRRAGLRLAALFLLCFLSPWTGLQMLPFVASCGFLLLILGIRRNFRSVLAMALGAILGLAALLLFYETTGTLGAFLESTLRYSSGRSGGFLSRITSGTFNHHNVLPKDFSYAVLLVGVVGMLMLDRLRHRPLYRPLMVAMVLNVFVTGALFLSGKFPTYYGWMTFAPLAVATCMWLEQPGHGRVESALGLAVCASTVCIGTGMHFAAGAWNWQERDYGIVRDIVARGIGPNDVVYADSAAYYALLGKNEFYTDFYLSAMTPVERARVTAIVVDPADAERVSADLGGGFVPQEAGFAPTRTGFLGLPLNLGFLTEYNYNLRIYRRTTAPPPSLPHP